MMTIREIVALVAQGCIIGVAILIAALILLGPPPKEDK